MLTVPEILKSKDEFYRKMLDGFGSKLRVSVPGIIVSFDPAEQTATVQPALREYVTDTGGNSSWVNLPLLLDVPICIPRAGGYSITFPVKKGDECLVIFSDMCIDAWFSNGGIQNQAEVRRHDLSDAICILGIWSQPNKISNYSTTNMQIRAEGGTSMIDIAPNEINLIGTIKKNGVVI